MYCLEDKAYFFCSKFLKPTINDFNRNIFIYVMIILKRIKNKQILKISCNEKRYKETL